MLDEHYQGGQTAIYYDDVCSMRVKILENRSAKDGIIYILEVLETPEFFEDTRVVPGSFREKGTKFYIVKSPGLESPGRWTLVDD